MPTLGIDVSAAQGDISADTWKAIAAAGVEFAYLKATEGQGYVDPTYHQNAERAQAAGLLTGAYHYLWANRPALEQAENFDRARRQHAHELPPVLDFESTKGMSPADAIYRASGFLDEAEKLLGRKFVIYTYPSFWRSLLDSRSLTPIEYRAARLLCERDLWIANYGVYSPAVPSYWAKYTFWQFDGDGGRRLPNGVDADFNWYDGDIGALRRYCGLAPVKEPGLELGSNSPANPIGWQDRAEGS